MIPAAKSSDGVRSLPLTDLWLQTDVQQTTKENEANSQGRHRCISGNTVFLKFTGAVLLWMEGAV